MRATEAGVAVLAHAGDILRRIRDLEHSPIELNRKGWRGIPKVLQIGESLLIDSEEIEDAEALFARLA